MTAPSPHRRPWLAALLALLCNGLGHLYAGRIGAAFAIQALWVAGATAFAFAARTGFRAAAAAVASLLALWVAQALVAARLARQTPPSLHRRGLRVLALLAFYGGSTAISMAQATALKRYIVATFYIPAVSMTPTLAVGDVVVVARSQPIERGAVVIHSPPDDAYARAPIVKRVVAIAGDTVEVRDGHLILDGVTVPVRPVEEGCWYEHAGGDDVWKRDPCVEFIEGAPGHAYRTQCTPFLACGDVAPVLVPPGHVFVLGDHRDHSADSRIYGPIAVSAILGRAKYVYFSLGPAGVRWDRIGLSVR